jgi:hypothetical protein
MTAAHMAAIQALVLHEEVSPLPVQQQHAAAVWGDPMTAAAAVAAAAAAGWRPGRRHGHAVE